MVDKTSSSDDEWASAMDIPCKVVHPFQLKYLLASKLGDNEYKVSVSLDAVSGGRGSGLTAS